MREGKTMWRTMREAADERKTRENPAGSQSGKADEDKVSKVDKNVF